MEFGRREKVIVAALIPAAAFVAWFFLLYGPLREEVARRSEQTTSIRSEVTIATQMGQNIEKLRENVAREKAEADSLLSRILRTGSIVQVLDELRVEGEAHGLTFDDLSPSSVDLFRDTSRYPEGYATSLVKLPITLEFRGRFLNAGRFFEAILAKPFMMSIGRIEIRAVRDELPNLSVSAIIHAYLREAE